MPHVFHIDGDSESDDWPASDDNNRRAQSKPKPKPTTNDEDSDNSSFYTKRIREKDAELNEMHAKLKALKREMAVLTVQDGSAQSKKKLRSKTALGSGPNPSTRQSGEDSGTSDLDHNPELDFNTEKGSDKDGEMKRVRQLGGKFVIMHMLWLGNTRAAFRTKLNPEFTPTERFNGDMECKRQGELADLLEVLPEEYHNRFLGNIYTIFDEGMNTERSNSASRICRRLGPRIFDAPPESFQDPDWRYDNFRVLAGWTEDANGQAHYTPFAPIIYRDYDPEGRANVNNLFLNEALFKVFNVIIRGPNALDTQPGRTSGKPTQDRIWGLTEVTPGAIAASAIFARYAISKDVMLQRQGAMTNIDYEADFNTYLRYLTSGLDQRKRSVERIFTMWNQIFFPSNAGLNKTRPTVAVNVDRATDAVFAALDEETESDQDTLDLDHAHVRPQSLTPPPAVTTFSHKSSRAIHADIAVVGQSDIIEEGDALATRADDRLKSITISVHENIGSSLATTTIAAKKIQSSRPRIPCASPATELQPDKRRSLRSKSRAPDNAIADHQVQNEESANATGKGKGPGGSRRGKKAAH